MKVKYRAQASQNDLEGDLATLPYRKDRGAQTFIVTAAAGALPQRLVAQRNFNLHLQHGRDESAPERGMAFNQVSAVATQVKGGSFGEQHDAFILAMKFQPIQCGRVSAANTAADVTAGSDGGKALTSGVLIADSLVVGTDSTLNTARGVGTLMGDLWQSMAPGMSIDITPPGSKCASEYGGIEQFPSDLVVGSEVVKNGFTMIGSHGWLRDPILIEQRKGDNDHTQLAVRFNYPGVVADTQLVGVVAAEYGLIYEVQYIIAFVDENGEPADEEQAMLMRRHDAFFGGPAAP